MKLQKELQDLFDELQTGAYNPTYHNYYYKEANQIIRRHVEALLIPRVSNCGGAIPYDSLSDSFKESIDSIEDNLNK